MLLSRGSFALSSMGRESRFPDRGRKFFSLRPLFSSLCRESRFPDRGRKVCIRDGFALDFFCRESRFPDRGRKLLFVCIFYSNVIVEKVDSPIGDENHFPVLSELPLIV